jgi:hypothetical protein
MMQATTHTWRPFMMGTGPNGLPATQWVRNGCARSGEASEVYATVEYTDDDVRLAAWCNGCQPPSVASLPVYQRVCEAMLQTHYGLSLNDTHLCEESSVRECIAAGWEPYEVLSEHAREADLDRLDISGVWGTSSKLALTIDDQQRALAMLGAVPCPQ